MSDYKPVEEWKYIIRSYPRIVKGGLFWHKTKIVDYFLPMVNQVTDEDIQISKERLHVDNAWKVFHRDSGSYDIKDAYREIKEHYLNGIVNDQESVDIEVDVSSMIDNYKSIKQ